MERGPTIALESTHRVVEPQHRSLRTAIEASWCELRPFERAALSQLAVFRQGFDQDAAEAVVQLEGFEDAPPRSQRWLALFVRHPSCIRLRRPPRALRWDMYEAIREYAAGFPMYGAADRHLAYCIDLGQRLLGQPARPNEATARARLIEELENLNAAFAYCSQAEPTNSSSLADLALVLFGVHRASRAGLAIGPLTQAIEAVGEGSPGRRIDLLVARGVCHREIGSLCQARRDFSEARRHVGQGTNAELDLEEGILAFDQGDLSDARTLLTRSGGPQLEPSHGREGAHGPWHCAQPRAPGPLGLRALSRGPETCGASG